MPRLQLLLLWFLCGCCWLHTAWTGEDGSKSEQRLQEEIFEDYDPRIRPSLSSRDPTQVTLGIAPVAIDGLDEKNFQFVLHAELSLEWTDERLSWSTSSFQNISVIRVSIERLWRPDIVVYNSPGGDPKRDSNALVYSSGVVKWIPQSTLVSFCPDPALGASKGPGAEDVPARDDNEDAPFSGGRNCIVTLGSWTFDGWKLDLSPAASALQWGHWVDGHQRWTLATDHCVVRRIVRRYPCCKEPYYTIAVTFALQPRTASRVPLLTMLSTAAASLLSLAALWGSQRTPSATLPLAPPFLLLAGIGLIVQPTLHSGSSGSCLVGGASLLVASVLLSRMIVGRMGQWMGREPPASLERALGSLLASKALCLEARQSEEEVKTSPWIRPAEALLRLLFFTHALLFALLFASCCL